MEFSQGTNDTKVWLVMCLAENIDQTSDPHRVDFPPGHLETITSCCSMYNSFMRSKFIIACLNVLYEDLVSCIKKLSKFFQNREIFGIEFAFLPF